PDLHSFPTRRSSDLVKVEADERRRGSRGRGRGRCPRSGGRRGDEGRQGRTQGEEGRRGSRRAARGGPGREGRQGREAQEEDGARSEEHTSELQSREN